ncbi:hypothetical protein [Xanthomonas vesicatoria]|uniref:hypothetical protein n=1 Tax=Xanthomonas vesicatoria TaxID=56460 RepID=UPI0012D88055|nr:hypothetical protein [Xanthomonas vesicatoria]MCC8682656.1 hypothetical protein [Xanthomonas vesicatoria]
MDATLETIGLSADNDAAAMLRPPAGLTVMRATFSATQHWSMLGVLHDALV